MSTESGNISYLPTDGLCYDPSEPKYWDTSAFQKELTRAYEICHGCRMCFKYCDSFPTLFGLIDTQYDGDVRKVNAQDTERIMDACFQCKLCEVQCPYTPREDHEFQLDFPKIVHRHKAISAKQNQPSLRDRVLRDPDTSAKAARASRGARSGARSGRSWAMSAAPPVSPRPQTAARSCLPSADATRDR